MILGVIANPRKENLQDVLDRILSVKGIEAFFSSELCDFVDSSLIIPEEEIRERCDFILSLGGDGTLLKAARLAGSKPVVGINMGGLGFLTPFRIEDCEKVISSILKGEFSTEGRMGIVAEIEERKKDFFALNDISITITGSSRMIELEIEAGGELLNRYRADGVIVSTPTGSTAYNLSSGGPIVHPAMDAVVITPICAHLLSIRPVVLPDIPLKIRASSKGESILLSADGQDETLLEPGETVNIRLRKGAVNLLRLKDTPRFFDILRMKLGWGLRKPID